MAPPLALDLYCGKGGWTAGLLAVGYRVVGLDNVARPEYPGELIVADLRSMDLSRFRGRVDVITASPPCEEFSRHGMPWTRAKNPPPPDLSLVEAAYRIRDEVRPRLFVLENVRFARPWLGPSVTHSGPFHFWGDAALMPPLPADYRKKESYASKDRAARAMIPLQIAEGFGRLCRAGFKESA